MAGSGVPEEAGSSKEENKAEIPTIPERKNDGIMDPLRVACYESFVLGTQQTDDDALVAAGVIPDGDRAPAVRFRAIRHAAAALGVTRQ